MSFSRAGGRPSGCGRSRLRRLLILAVAAANLGLVGGAAGAGGSSGGAGVPPKSSPKPATRASAPAHNPLSGRGMWIWELSASNGGNLSSIIATARTYGLSTLMIKSGDGTSAWSQFNSTLVAELHAAGLKVCAWQYVYGAHPISEAYVGAAAVHAGADCLMIDAESEYQGRYIQAQDYIKRLRQLIGSRFPVALAGFPYIDYHPSFPYSVFLGPGGAQYNTPQMYWVDIGTSVDNVFAHTYDFNSVYERPIEPLGEVSGNPPPGQVFRFRQLSRTYDATGVSWWDWQENSTRDWWAIEHPIGNLTGITTDVSPPVLSPKDEGGIWAGDLVVWAQEHLVAAGDAVEIDGDFGPATQSAVEQFQTAHGLPVTGLVDQPTWQALLARKPVAVTWVKQRGQTIAVAARGGTLRLGVPWSARLPPRRYEIPRDLGAGRPPR
ncbi:MAG TPA: peptidoglycan-binding domain-containing protein [Solirubrobacteraceae bacterium]|nr:peptidoglycan-binding domain-containing protein [Solirubrobacteraceae bacterium]